MYILKSELPWTVIKMKGLINSFPKNVTNG